MSEHVYSENVLEKLSSEPNNLWKRLLIFLVILGLVIWGNTGSNFQGITEKGVNIAKAIVYGITHPETLLLYNFTSKGIPMLLLETISIAFSFPSLVHLLAPITATRLAASFNKSIFPLYK